MRSRMELEGSRRWKSYTRAKEVMLQRSSIEEAPWWVVQGGDKKRARLNCSHHLLAQVPYEPVTRPEVVLPPREYNADYVRQPTPESMIVPEIY